jgi:dTDP-4-dehydrorhamnose reductase
MTEEEKYKPRRILVFGGTGLLGQDMIRTFAPFGSRVKALSSEDCDISDLDRVCQVVLHFSPHWVINCAAFANVDGCETDSEKAYRVNSLGAGMVAMAVKANADCRLVHISTDYVFDGEADRAYTETDVPSPINVYGQSKLEGERRVMGIMPTACIARVGWLYGQGRRTWIDAQIDAAINDATPLPAMVDQIGVPTWTNMVAGATVTLLQRQLTGIFHIVPQGYCSRYEEAVYVQELLGNDAPVPAVRTNDLTLPAKRPRRAVLDGGLFERITGLGMLPWRGYLKRYVFQSRWENMQEVVRKNLAKK